MNEAGRLHEEFFTAAGDESVRRISISLHVKRKHQASLNLQNWGGRTRTSNFPVNSRAVCQLTYTPMCPTTTLPTVTRLQKTDAQTRSGEQITQAEKRAPPKPLGAGSARSPSLRATPPGPPDSGDWRYRCDLRPDRRTSA